MKLDISEIENGVYAKICTEFADFCEKKLEIYKTVFGFLKTVTVEDMLSLTTNEIYKKYEVFCKENEFQPLKNTVFSKVICKCGFNCFRTTRSGQKAIYYVLD